ncbi:MULTISPECIES: zinc ABC transporter substrate-binding protein [Cellvibrio]|uniref:High-affinity zinc uptake system protein ZnuA n=1 Tax=Cellvibrio fibrivorans TaxID=126350 RepID=A0ABU1UU74_9GAMM|nr:zinc ABC transporter substrate-binding protein [Cellvibrio fibrivorans]MDR7088739.1 zinc transport system substrate-binding protein [Cellvibrio fibrivorans]
MRYCGVSFQQGLALISLALLLAVPAQAKLQVLASIKPLALIAREVAGDQADVVTLLPITASPHDYPLKMSDHKRLLAADLVLWVGPELESFLARPLANLPANRLITSYELTGLHWPLAVKGDHHHSNHVHVGHDPHIWLDPRNAVLIAQVLAARLGELQPEFASVFRTNAERFATSVQLLDQQLAKQLEPVKTMGFAVYHEGYGHFVGRYGLHQVAYVTYTPERRPGARHLQELREVLAKEGQCLFMEPYYKAQGMDELAKTLNLRIGLLDPIGEQQVSSYQQLLQQLGQSFLTCLADRRGH